jgi:hypothetical protein
MEPTYCKLVRKQTDVTSLSSIERERERVREREEIETRH